MSLVTLPFPVCWGPLSGFVPTNATTSGGSIGSNATMTFDAAGDKIAIIFQAASTTPPDAISFYIPTVTTAGSAGTIDATLETIDTSTGNPSGTAVTNSATGSSTISTTGVKTISGMAGTASLTIGGVYAVVLTAGSGWNRNLLIMRTIGSNNTWAFPYTNIKDSAGGWTTNGMGTTTGGFCFGLKDSGGNCFNMPSLSGPYSAFAVQVYSDSTNPDERGNRFSLPFAATICGAVSVYTAGSTPGVNSDYAVSLYSGHTGTPSQLATVAMEGITQAQAWTHISRFDSVDLTANTTYCLALKAAGSSSLQLARWDFAANADLAWLAGTGVYSTTRDGGAGNPSGGGNAFSDVNTSVYAIFPLLSRLDDGAGGGISSHIAALGRGLH